MIVSHSIRKIFPQNLQTHLLDMQAHSEHHQPVQRHDASTHIRRILDIPLPIEADCTPYRCMTCKRNGGLHMSYPITDADMNSEFPGILKHSMPKVGTCWMTRRFVLYLVQSFIEKLNVRSMRRALAEYYSTNSLALCGGARGLQYLSAIPSQDAMRSILRCALYKFLKEKVRQWRKHINVYSGSAIRGDGNYEIATRIAVYDPVKKTYHRPHTVILGWTSLDGCLLDVPRASRTEAIQDVIRDLEPVVDEISRDRMEQGMDLIDCLPASHSTDSYGKHRNHYVAFYDRKASELITVVNSSTPKGDATGATAIAQEGLTDITGDPLHDIIAMRRSVGVLKCDTQDFIADYSDGITRLSVDPVAADDAAPDALADVGIALLQSAIQDSVGCFQAKIASDPGGVIALRTFLGQPNVMHSPTWKTLFKTLPPRGVVARLARRTQVSLHTTCKYNGYRTLEDFKNEMKRVRRWYKTQKKKTRRRFGIHRNLRQSVRVKVRCTVMTKKLTAHFKRLFKKLRLEGLWQWRKVALAIRKAGVPVQTGTISVERMWSAFLEVLPAAGRRFTEDWFEILAMIFFLRYNYRHFSVGSLPKWCQRDYLLAQRLDGFAACVAALHDAESTHVSALFEAFKL